MRKSKINFPKDKFLKHNKLNDISEWNRVSDEWVGAREKFMVSPLGTDHQYMVKFPKYGHNEPKIELFNCYLGKSLGLNVASYFPCIYKGKHGVITRSFLDPKSELWEMKELICHYSKNPNLEEKMGRHPEVLKEHNIDNIFLILQEDFGKKILRNFFQMIGFDCLIGHGDRHWTNYGVILSDNDNLSYQFAPVYDTASGYLLEMTDDKLHQILKERKLEKNDWYRPKKKALCKIICKDDLKTNHVELFEYILDNFVFSEYTFAMIDPVKRFCGKLSRYLLRNAHSIKELSKDKKFAIMKVLEMRKNILMSIIEKHNRESNV